jgi:ABC-type glycerol-3-phosphate transport system substrate-binding protein
VPSLLFNTKKGDILSSLKNIIVAVLSLSVVIVAIVFFTNDYDNYVPQNEITGLELSQAYETLATTLETPRYTYIDYLNDLPAFIQKLEDDQIVPMNDPEGLFNNEIQSLSKTLSLGDSAIYTVTVDDETLVHFAMEALMDTRSLNNLTLSVKINGVFLYDDQKTIDVPMTWMDVSKDFQVDRYGDQVLPNQMTDDDWQIIPLYNNTYVSVDPLLFVLNEGLNTIEITNTSSTLIELGDLVLLAPESLVDYETYRQNKPQTDIEAMIRINATEYTEKNSSFTHLMPLNNPAMDPFDPVYKKLNIIDGTSWDLPGQSITYTFDVEQAGNYQLAFHYQNMKHDYSVFRSIKINGKVPFEELKAYEFEHTGGQDWAIEVLGNEDPYLFYFEEGTHSITMRVESEPLEQGLRYLQMVIDHINKFSLDIRKIAGKEVDRDRTWKFTEYIPETPDYLDAYEILLKSAIAEFAPYAPNGSESTTISYIQKALYKLTLIQENPDKVPLYLEDLSGGTGSIAQYLGDSLTMVREQPMYLNMIFAYHDQKLPRPNANFFIKSWSGIQAFFASFTSDKYSLTEEEDVVDVWVNRPITYVDMMQKMADQTFTPDTGVKVKISVMPDPNKLVMASAADQQPDVALGLASYMPYDLAIRGAAYDLSSFPDYWEFAGQFAPGAFVPYILNDKSYALPETLDFNVIIYRKDIFDALNFLVPDTWDEVIQILPELQQYGMNFYHPIAGGVSIKWFYQTSGFIYQYGGKLYSETGVKSSINSTESIAGLTFLNQLFTNYSLPEQVPSFYNSFRYAILPIGISDFGTYLLIKNAAPELSGLWEIAPYPSVTVNGEENRHYIANGTAGLILSSTTQPDDSWSFLKWWMSVDTQSQFAFNLQSTYGPTYAWLSGNIDAFRNSPFPEKDKAIILDQVRWLVDVPRTPGQYMLERSLSDVWNTAVYDGTPTGIAVDRYTIVIDREIRKKMIEFGFLNQEGEIIIPYTIRDIDWVRMKIEEANNG